MYDESMIGNYLPNKSNAVQLLNWLHMGAPHTEFNIHATIEHDVDSMGATCCTVCCAGGAASQMLRGVFGQGVFEETAPWDDVEYESRVFLGLPPDTCWTFEIFCPLDWFAVFIDAGAKSEDCEPTGPMVAYALHVFSQTGKAIEAMQVAATAHAVGRI